ncbi:MAG: GNAT family N-acetyltransferase [Muribaculaceae bacterium]|nr:GNAT family N-acetyltransferase [Muribaculaceae bacterium]MDE5968114.1 GNAT family N-acetyltransferase [Muribaculaceae bacterium]MDE7394355.1 GNAT family N-acetyltransferase [Muribaculaceae bacterium]
MVNFDFGRLSQIQLSDSTDLKPFKCVEDDLNDFLFEDAKHFQAELLAVTYLIESKDENVTIAYYSLLADKIVFNPEEKKSWNKLNRSIPNEKRRRSYPAVKIGRLAVNADFSGMGIGTFILDSIKYAFAYVKRLGCRFITVDALASAIPFYERNGFRLFTEKDADEDTRLMFFDLKNFVI